MRKYCLLFGLLLSAALLFTGCANGDGDSGLDGDPSGYEPLPMGQETNGDETWEQDPADSRWAKIPMVMLDGKLYYDTGRESTVEGRCGVMDGEITATVDGTETPTEENQSNFGTGFPYQYGAEDTIEIYMHEKWIIFEHREGSGSQIRFGDKMVDADGLSQETLDWLAWFNSLPEEEQLAVSAIPSDLLEKCGLAKTEDAPAAD